MGIVSEAREFMMQQMAGNDASHDFAHVERVASMTLEIAESEGIRRAHEVEVLMLAALLHDIGDHKYSDDPNAAFDWLIEKNFSNANIVQEIIDNVSYSKNEANGFVEPLSIFHAIVQDADRLDAIGTIGIARAFAYNKGTLAETLDHFDEKLFKLAALMKTDYAKALAVERHDAMISFYEKMRLAL
jgi:uncharacterized protein